VIQGNIPVIDTDPMSSRSPFDPPAVQHILAGFIQDSPTPWHAVKMAAERLRAARFAPHDPGGAWEDVAPMGYVAREGSLIAWRWPDGMGAHGMRLLGAHTDSPGLRLRPRPDSGTAGYRQLAVEVYGGALLNSWLDRDLTLAGRVVLADRDAPDGLDVRLFHHDSPLLRVPQLAIHLDREVNDNGLRLDRSRHLKPVWGLGEPTEGELRSWLASEVGAKASSVVGFDVACVDTQRPAVLGRKGELFAGSRLDNLVSCFGGVEAFARMGVTNWPCAVVLFDHEEVGSTSSTGALGAWLSQVLERLAFARGLDHTALLAALPTASLLSADMAHATHPNYPERHDAGHGIRLDGGPVLKHNVNQRYATSGIGAARFRLACSAAEVEVQDYSHRGDLACGSTIGPLASAGLAIDTVDVGMPMLSMHSCRELMATGSIEPMVDAFEAWLSIPPGTLPAPTGPEGPSGQAVATPRRRNRPMEHPPR
jgi:aspartyl aminopeptidase